MRSCRQWIHAHTSRVLRHEITEAPVWRVTASTSIWWKGLCTGSVCWHMVNHIRGAPLIIDYGKVRLSIVRVRLLSGWAACIRWWRLDRIRNTVTVHLIQAIVRGVWTCLLTCIFHLACAPSVIQVGNLVVFGLATLVVRLWLVIYNAGLGLVNMHLIVALALRLSTMVKNSTIAWVKEAVQAD